MAGTKAKFGKFPNKVDVLILIDMKIEVRLFEIIELNNNRHQ